MNRITKKFRELSEIRRSALIGYMTAGFPSLDFTGKLVMTMESSGVDIIELGVPFSDPVADGPVIQRASEYALRRGITLSGVINFVKGIRKITEIPVLLMGYYNPLLAYGLEKFSKTAVNVGVDGLIVPDLPPEEGGELSKSCRKYGLSLVFLVAPTSPPERIKKIASASFDFCYCVSVTGVTGERTGMSAGLKDFLISIRTRTRKPFVVGFGISTPEQVRCVAPYSDGVVLGSALVNMFLQEKNPKIALRKACSLISRMAGSLNGPG